MLKTNIYNIDKEFDYPAVRNMVLESLEKIAKQEVLERSNISSDIVSDFGGNDDYSNYVKLYSPATPELKLKIRNTTHYLLWRLSILKRDNFTCHLCHSNMKDNKRLRLEVHHAKTFNDICEANNVSTVEQAFACKELWDLDNGVSICYRCHKNIEKLRTKLRNMFLVRQIKE